MLVRYDPFRQFDRAFRSSDRRFDLPGVSPESIDVEVERNVVTVRAERSWQPPEGAELLAQERLQGSVSRQVMLGESLDTERLEATYDAGVLTLTIPVAEQAKPRKVEIHVGAPEAIDATSQN